MKELYVKECGQMINMGSKWVRPLIFYSCLLNECMVRAIESKIVYSLVHKNIKPKYLIIQNPELIGGVNEDSTKYFGGVRLKCYFTLHPKNTYFLLRINDFILSEDIIGT